MREKPCSFAVNNSVFSEGGGALHMILADSFSTLSIVLESDHTNTK